MSPMVAAVKKATLSVTPVVTPSVPMMGICSSDAEPRSEAGFGVATLRHPSRDAGESSSAKSMPRPNKLAYERSQIARRMPHPAHRPPAQSAMR